jgi:hypothetical protein
MDKKIKKMQKTTKKLESQEEQLLKADKKRDKVCDYGAKMMKKKKKQKKPHSRGTKCNLIKLQGCLPREDEINISHWQN